MAEKNIRFIKKAIYQKLSTDAQLLQLLGGDKIFLDRNPEKIVYPSIVYSVITDTDTPFDENENTGKITETTFQVTIFSNEQSSEQSDNIESRIKKILNGKGVLSTDDIIDFGCNRQYMSQNLNVEVNVWLTTCVYALRSAPNEDNS